MFKSVPTKDSQFPHLPKFFEMEFGLQKVECLYLYILFFAYFLFGKTQLIREAGGVLDISLGGEVRPSPLYPDPV